MRPEIPQRRLSEPARPRCVLTGGGRTSSGQLTFDVDFIRSAKGSVLVTARADARHLHGDRSRSPCRAGCAGRARAGSRPSTGCCPASTSQRKARDASRGRLDGRTVEIQRLIGRVAAGHRRPPRPRRAHGLGRLRRDPGRRRHALRGHQRRRTWRCTARSRGWSTTGDARGAAARRHGGGGLRRHRRRRAPPRPAVRGGRAGRDRHERRDDRRRPVRRGAGHRGGHALLARAPRRPAGARRGRDHGDPRLQLRACAAGRDRARHDERRQGARARPPAGGTASSRWTGGMPRRRTARRSRPTP